MHYTASCNTQSSVPEDGQNNCPKHVELTGIINKPLLLHLVGCLWFGNFSNLQKEGVMLHLSIRDNSGRREIKRQTRMKDRTTQRNREVGEINK